MTNWGGLSRCSRCRVETYNWDMTGSICNACYTDDIVKSITIDDGQPHATTISLADLAQSGKVKE